MGIPLHTTELGQRQRDKISVISRKNKFKDTFELI